MVKFKKIIFYILLLFSILILAYGVFQIKQQIKESSRKVTSKIEISTKKPNKNIKEREVYAWLQIPKINLEQELVDPNSVYNNVEENITIMEGSSMPNIKNSILILAAHSGNRNNAFFNDLYLLQENDKINVLYQNKKYLYNIYKIYEEDKTGSIHIQKIPNKQQIILTTCSITNQNKQLVLIGELI